MQQLSDKFKQVSVNQLTQTQVGEDSDTVAE